MNQANTKQIKALAARAAALLAELEASKALYAELDQVTVELQEAGFKAETFSNGTIVLVDNFASKNTVFRPAAVRRFELKIEKVS